MFNRHSVRVCTRVCLSPTDEIVYAREDTEPVINLWAVEYSETFVHRYLDQFGQCYLFRHPRSNLLMIQPDISNRLNFTTIKVVDSKSPIIEIDGTEVYSFRDASLEWLGYIHPNIKQIIISEDSPRLEFEINKLKLLYNKDEGKGVKVPVFKYDNKGKMIYGLKNLKERFPDADISHVKSKFKISDRSQDIINKYQLEMLPNNLISVADGELTFNITDFRRYLKDQGDGISNQTWKKVRDELIYKANHR